MRQLRTLYPVLAVLARSLAGQSPECHVEKLGGDVYAVVRHEPIAFVNNANSLVVVGDNGVIVVDAQFTRKATNETIAAIRGITSKPVRYVINTHWHDDHVAGNQVYRDSFPGVLFVSHNNTRTDLVTLGAPNRKGTVQAGPGFVARFKQLLAQGLGDDSTPVVQRERAAMESTVRVGEQYFAEAPGFREVLATLTFDHEVTLYPVMHDDAYLRSVSSMLTAVVDLTRAAVSDGKTIEQVRATVTLPDFRASVAGEDKWLNSMFTHFFLNPTVTRAYEDATRARK